VVKVVSTVDEEDGIRNITFDLSPLEMSTLIFAGMTETTYDTSLISSYTRDIKKTMPNWDSFQEACTNNGVSEKDGYLYIQIGIQAAVIAGINTLNSQIELQEQGDDTCGLTTEDLLAPTDQD
jgi:hypothetical protein